MWQSATAFAGLLASQQHLLFGGLGEAIAVIVGGVVSVITLRKATRSAPRPAPTPAPVSRRPAAPPAYGAPAPPTAPARRLHPGPISLSAPTPEPASKPHAEGDDDTPMSSLFNPDIFERPQPAPPLLRPLSAITAEWRAQMAASPSTLAPAPIWNRTLFARPARPAAAAPLALDPLADATSLVTAPPIWRRPGASASDIASLESLEAELPPPVSAAPVWGSWLSAGGAASPADDAHTAQLPAQRLDTPGEPASDEQHPPIWSSFLRRE